jgi:hypothetical protein
VIDYSLTTPDAIWAFGVCVLAFGLGFGLGTKIKLVRKIEETM